VILPPGYWWHGIHDGQAGWWWVAGGVWYFYPAPVTPSPGPYAGPAIGATPPSYQWCANPPGYFPQVQSCNVPWQVVPAGTVPPKAPVP